jgi:transcription initiation factor IIE alpha subunit
MIEGRCAKCGTHHVGWALQFLRYQTCPRCGAGLDIYENGQLVAKGYSPFTAEEYVIKTPSVTASEEEEESVKG